MKISKRQLQRYRHALLSCPPPGGNGCHPHLLRIANRGVRAGIDNAVMFADIRKNVPAGGRSVPDGEIWDAIERAAEDHDDFEFVTARKPINLTIDGPAVLNSVINAGRSTSEMELRSKSPITIPDDPRSHRQVLLTELYRPGHQIFSGNCSESGAESIRPMWQWQHFMPGPFIIPNPLSGQWGPKKGGGWSLRADSCVAEHRFCVVEFDNLSLDAQIAFWAAVPLPIVALIHTGGKSIHAWLAVNCKDRQGWQRDVRQRLYGRYLVPLGVDPVCGNPSRLSRLPGVWRSDKRKYQRLLFLDPIGGAIQR